MIATPFLTRPATLLGVLLLPAVALADVMDWKKLDDDPAGFIGKPIEVLGYCAQGGVNGDADGYQCSTEGNLYISTPAIKPASARKKIEENCGGLDVVERSDFCRAKISFTPQSVSTSTELEPGKTITIISTDIATVKF
ncbi:MAG: hypothetical protein ACM3MH_08325 [Actinomycetota bacterium]